MPQMLSFRIPNNYDILKWVEILTEYPIGQSKVKLLEKSNHPIIVGILTDHLMKVARKIGIPNSYIKCLSQARKEYKNYGKNEPADLFRDRMMVQTHIMLIAVSEKIVNNKSILQKLKTDQKPH